MNDVVDRIVGKVLEYGEPLGVRGKCWIWQGAKSSAGYGRVKLSGRLVSPHRAMWEWLYEKPIPHGLDIDHLCRKPACVNPLHLEPVTRSTNNVRGLTGGKKRQDNLCSNGHLVEGQNAKRYSNRIVCRICQNKANKRYMRKTRGLVA